MAGSAPETRGRLSRSADFGAVYRRGRSRSSRHLVVYDLDRPSSDQVGPRLGIALSRKVGGAVERNRLKRQLREAFASIAPALDRDRDVVVVGRPGLVQAVHREGYEWLVGELRTLVGSAA